MDKHELRRQAEDAKNYKYPVAVDPSTVIALLDEIAELEGAHSRLAELYTDLEMTHRKHMEDTAPAFDELRGENRQARTLIQSLATMLDDLLGYEQIQNEVDDISGLHPISVYSAVVDDADCFLSGREYDPDEDTDRWYINPQKTKVK